MGKPKGESRGLAYLKEVRPEAIDRLLGFFRESARHLDPKTRFLISVVTKVISGSDRGIDQYVRRALEAGATPHEIIDAVLCAYPCAGLTRVVDAVDVILDMGLEGFSPAALRGSLPPGAGIAPPAPASPAAGERPAATFPAEGTPRAEGTAPAEGAPPAEGKAGWVEAGTLDELENGHRLRLVAGRHDVAIFQVDGEVFAIGGRCPHAGGPLSEGMVHGGLVICPLHAWRFDLRSGVCPERPRSSVPVYDVKIDESRRVLVRLEG